MSDEYSNLRALLLQFPDFQKQFQDYSAAEQEILTKVSRRHTAADRTYLESKFPAAACRGHMSEEDRYVFLTPFSEGQYIYLPLLSIDMDFARAWPLVSINVLHYAIIPSDSVNGRPLRCFCYRYDKPAAVVGDHNYFHVQFAHGHPKGQKIPGEDHWISTKDPSIPVDATNAIELFLSAVVALRNKAMTRRQYLEEWSQAGLPISSFLAPMAFERWKPHRNTPPAP